MPGELSWEDKQKDYRLMGYHKKETFDAKGDLTVVEYYAGYDGTTYSQLMVKETRTYTRGASTGLLEKRDCTIEWFDVDETTVIGTKTTTKHYDGQKGYMNNQRARFNLINKASIWLLDDLASNEVYAINAVDQAGKKFTVTGNHAAKLSADMKPEVSGSTGNDQAYTIFSATDNGANTDVVVNEAIPSATADGSLLVGEAQAKEFLRDVRSERGGYIAGDTKPALDAIADSTRAYMTGTRKSTLDSILNIEY